MAVKAFPTAVGAAALITGGRGGTIIHVTNLNNSGAGSFREALETVGTRTIVFDVSGVIVLTSDIYTDSGNFTVAGQTAPEGGITIVGTADIRVDANNHIWRYIRFRSGYDVSNVDGGWTNTTSSVNTRNRTDFIFDHCSSGLAKETSGLGGGQNETVGQTPKLTSQNNLIVESARGTLVGDSNDSDASTVTVYRNGWINSGWRFPKGGGTINLDVINTYVSNWQGRTIRMDGYDFKLNLINNTYQAGNLTRLTDNPEIMFTMQTNATMNPEIWDEGTTIIPYIYNSGASTYDPTPAGYPADISLAWDPFDSSTEPINSAWFVNARLPLNTPVENILPSNEVKDFVLDNAGANKYFDNNGDPQIYRDKLDEGAIAIAKGLGNTYVINGITYDISDGTKIEEADYETISLGLINDTPSNTRPVGFYNTSSHIPEIWFQANVPSGQTENDLAPSGYTWIEEYINQVDGDVIIVNSPVITRTDSNPTTYTVGDTYLPPTGTWTDVEDGSGTATIGGATVNMNVAGTYNVTLFHTDTDGNTGTLVIPIIVQAEAGENINYNISEQDRQRGKNYLVKLIKR